VTIALLDYGTGNLPSVEHALRHVGADVDVTGDPERLRDASGLVVPGVGHFGACMTALVERGLDAAIKDFVATGRPVFGVCVGMQVLFEGSEEAPGVAGLGIFDATVKRLPDDVTVPHMGWDKVAWRDEPLHPYVADIPYTWFYFAHSFAPLMPGAVGVTQYGGLMAAAVGSGNVFATQFHPEKSGRWGLALYRAFVERAER
jgi:imidazole glycerol-phosphate synthase subunit HisH